MPSLRVGRCAPCVYCPYQHLHTLALALVPVLWTCRHVLSAKSYAALDADHGAKRLECKSCAVQFWSEKSNICTTCTNVDCGKDRYRSGTCSPTTTAFTCNTCKNTKCPAGEYRSGVCGGSKNEYTCQKQPTCPNRQFLKGATGTRRGTCQGCSNSKCGVGNERVGACSGSNDGWKCQSNVACQALVDLVFLVDASGSVGPKNFEKQLNFVKNIVDKFDIGKDKTRVSLSTFSSEFNPWFGLDKHTTKSAVKSAITGVLNSYAGGNTYTAEALDLLNRLVLRKRRTTGGVDTVVVLLTDGKATDSKNVEAAARKIHGMGVTVYSMGVGAAIDANELKLSATPSPTDAYVIRAASFAELDSWADTVQCRACATTYWSDNICTACANIDCGSFTTRRILDGWPVAS